MPLIVVPLGWSDKQCDAVSVEVLQEFEKDAYIMVCNIPGKTHLRYLQVIGRQPQRLQNGMRTVTFSMAVANSNANARARAAEEPQQDVDWVLGGSNLLIISEVDDKTSEITFQFQALAEDELHARQLLTYWAQFVCRWSGRIVPPRLIESESTRSR
ncbi:hypothetical protein ON010_g19117 [Phytophthora cinnamomi]|nr:hypothetical protein ON010_g19117 [Phytophthora cinnamomi]